MTRWAAVAGAAILVSACAHVGVIDDGLNYSQRQARFSGIADWDLSGQLIIDTGERRDRVRINWEQRGERMSLMVRGIAFGAGSFRISGNAERLTIEGRGETRVLDDPELDLTREVGWWLPIASLPFWLLGRPDDAFSPRVNRGAYGTLSTLDQRDWRLAYEEYQLAEGLLVPRIVTLTHSTLELRLTVSGWEPAGS